MIIGIVGKIAAGKTTVAKFLEEIGFCRVSCSDPLVDLLKGKIWRYTWVPEVPIKGEPTRETLIELGRLLKEKYGEDVLIRLSLDRTRECENVVIDGVRSRGEVEAIKRRGGIVIYVEARPEIRFERLRRRGADKDREIRTLDDLKRFDEIEERLYRTSELKALADYVIVNEGTLEELREKVMRIINLKVR
ncbi:AAA family ATPase [Pyrococcus yayanosii]|uniref:Dephospho-CoA kinase n=1 Tax=Pyrococcus yayanosii (strain CH1 / JCM 16557) TaxID=529709 RepID=F8AFA1_PYRYC|nr:AAA family ATPase [Pyrococcus yayanosii]AEH24932.1 dephospho-CoA kinase [Pyrococcus yayanosii CH1]